MLRSGSETIIRQRVGLTPVPPTGRLDRDWLNGDVVELEVSGVSVQPLSTTEYIDDREFAESHWKFIVQGVFDVLNTDRILWVTDPDPNPGVGNSFWRVAGTPEYWKDLRGRPHHTTFLAHRWVA